MRLSRRELLRTACCTAGAFGISSSFSRFGLINALAQSPTDFRALVCIFLFGGNDANNLLIPMDTVGYANYQSIRGSLALAQGSLQPITSRTEQVGTKSFGLHPNLPELQGLYNKNELAVLANVGTLVEPVTRTQYLNQTETVPANLFSHAD